MAGALQVTLERDGHDQPWGFRLQGGSDVSLPLSVQRVLVGTPSDNLLKKGDVILRISQTDAKGMSHQAAADLFNNAGNQITVVIKRAGVAVPAASLPASALGQPSSGNQIIDSGVQVLPPKPDPTNSRNFPHSLLNLRERHDLQKEPTNHNNLSIKNQPYRTMPIIQPSPKIQDQLGPGSQIHLKMQGEHITGIKEPVPVNQNQINRERGNELLMKQKTQQTLSNVTSHHHSEFHVQESFIKRTDVNQLIEESPAVQIYTPEENLQTNMEQTGPLINPRLNLQRSNLLPSKVANQGTSKLSPITPNKPQQVILTPNKEFNPQESATWLAIQETEPAIDPEKVKNYSSMKEHEPIYSEVYQTPSLDALIQQRKSQSPQPPSLRVNQPNDRRGKSPVAEFLPQIRKGNDYNDEVRQSPTRAAALADSIPIEHMNREPIKIPMYESNQDFRIPGRKTNAIGGRKKIAQSNTFNKVMMDVLGE